MRLRLVPDIFSATGRCGPSSTSKPCESRGNPHMEAIRGKSLPNPRTLHCCRRYVESALAARQFLRDWRCWLFCEGRGKRLAWLPTQGVRCSVFFPSDRQFPKRISINYTKDLILQNDR